MKLDANTLLVVFLLILPGYVAHLVASNIGRRKLETHRYAWLSFFVSSLFLGFFSAFVLSWAGFIALGFSDLFDLLSPSKEILAKDSEHANQSIRQQSSLLKITLFATFCLAPIWGGFVAISEEKASRFWRVVERVFSIPRYYRSSIEELLSDGVDKIVAIRLTEGIQGDNGKTIVAYEGYLFVAGSVSVHEDGPEASGIFLSKILTVRYSNGDIEEKNTDFTLADIENSKGGVWLPLSNVAAVEVQVVVSKDGKNSSDSESATDNHQPQHNGAEVMKRDHTFQKALTWFASMVIVILLLIAIY